MGILILQMQISLDGFVSAAVPGTNWQVWNWGDDWTWDTALRRAFNATFTRVGAILLSRPMAQEGYLDHWAGIAERHAGDPDFAFAAKVGELPKFVITNRLDRPTWPNTAIVPGAFAEAVASAKQSVSGDLITFGGTGFARALLHEALVDELQLYVNPAALGSGDALFGPDLQRFSLLGAQAYDCGIVVQTYRPAS